jgi:hypothetical protein
VEEQVLDPDGTRRRSRAVVLGAFTAVAGVILVMLWLIARMGIVLWGWVA